MMDIVVELLSVYEEGISAFILQELNQRLLKENDINICRLLVCKSISPLSLGTFMS